jgi:ribosomal protein S8
MKKKYNLNFNFIIADFVARLSVGLLRKLRFIKIVKTKIALRLLRILYKQGVIRSFRIESDFIAVYFKFQNGQPIGKLSIVSRPGKRCY